MSKETIMNEIQEVEKAIKASEDLRQRAITYKSVYETQLKETEEEFKALGTTAEQAKKEIEEIDKKIAVTLEKIKGMIPYELLKEFHLYERV